MPDKTRAAVIGATGKGNYGHGHDTVFVGLAGVELVAIADENPAGLQSIGKHTGVKRLYRDYREMLANEKPAVVAIGPRWTDQRVAMIAAAAEAGCQIYCEKPLAADLADVDRILAACEKANVKLAVPHQNRGTPPAQQAARDVRAGKYGRLIRLRGRGKEDGRGGGEDLIVLGTHILDLMTLFAGPPRWVSAHVTVGGRDATRADARAPSEPVGKVAGDCISAAYGFDRDVRATFDSRAKAGQGGGSPFALFVECEKATLCVRGGEVYTYPAGVVVPGNPKLAWSKLWVENWHFFPDHKPRPMSDWMHRTNQLLVLDLLDAAKSSRAPLSSGDDARFALEMIQGVYASHLAGGARQGIPLKQREHPLG